MSNLDCALVVAARQFVKKTYWTKVQKQTKLIAEKLEMQASQKNPHSDPSAHVILLSNDSDRIDGCCLQHYRGIILIKEEAQDVQFVSILKNLFFFPSWAENNYWTPWLLLLPNHYNTATHRKVEWMLCEYEEAWVFLRQWNCC